MCFINVKKIHINTVMHRLVAQMTPK